MHFGGSSNHNSSSYGNDSYGRGGMGREENSYGSGPGRDSYGSSGRDSYGSSGHHSSNFSGGGGNYGSSGREEFGSSGRHHGSGGYGGSSGGGLGSEYGSSGSGRRMCSTLFPTNPLCMPLTIYGRQQRVLFLLGQPREWQPQPKGDLHRQDDRQGCSVRQEGVLDGN